MVVDIERVRVEEKSGWYKGYYSDSSWELAFIIYKLEHNIPFKKNTQKFSYIFEGKERTYTPDFIMEDGSYVEIKGYKTHQWEEKLRQFKERIIVLYEKEMDIYIDYVIEKIWQRLYKTI